MSEWYDKRLLILGCGNILFGDDGFGPEVARRCLDECPIPPDVAVLNAGTSVRNILFDVLLSENKPSRLSPRRLPRKKLQSPGSRGLRQKQNQRKKPGRQRPLLGPE